MIKCLRPAFFAFALSSTATSSPAQPIPPADARRVVEQTASLFQRNYVDEKRRSAVVSMLKRNLASGRYAVTDVRELSTKVTDDLRGFTKDNHLSLTWDPAAYTTASQRTAPEPDLEAEVARAKAINHGLVETKVLTGNVRYLKIRSFEWIPDSTGAVYDNAMEFLRDGSAAIIDLRGNGGGSTSAVRYAISHFMPARSEELMMTFSDDQGRPDQSRVLSYLPAGRVNVPLFVLIDGESVSAAEEFVYHVKQFKLGTLVGSRTKGAANNNLLYPVAPGFVASISVFRPLHAVDNNNWEGTGIQPDISALAGRELRTAQVAALKALTTSKSPVVRKASEWAIVRAQAELEQPVMTAADLQRYAGRFQDRELRLESGKLLYVRPGRQPAELIYLGNELFGLADTDRMRIRVTPGSGLLEILYDDGSTVTFERSP
jgi:hypothetical protein